MDDLHERIEWNMANHAPDPAVIPIFEDLRAMFKRAAHAVVTLVPMGREQALALTHLEEGLMQAVAGVARNQKDALVQLATQRQSLADG